MSGDGGTANVEAHDCFLKGREIMFGPIKNREVFDRAREQFERAIQLDPGYGAAYAALAQAYGFDYNNHWSAAIRRPRFAAPMSSPSRRSSWLQTILSPTTPCR